MNVFPKTKSGTLTMNKKAQIFEWGLVLTVFVICAFALTTFLVYNSKTKTSFVDVHQIFLLYDRQEIAEFYAKEAFGLAISEAYSNTIKESIMQCPSRLEFFTWTETCIPKNNEIEAIFIKNIKQSMEKMLSYSPELRNHDFSLEKRDNSIYFKMPLNLNVSTRSLKNTITINYDSEISVNESAENMDLNFEGIYNSVKSRWNFCKGLNDFAKVKNCMSLLTFKNWNFNTLADNSFELKTKSSYYFGDKIEPIELNFKLEK